MEGLLILVAIVNSCVGPVSDLPITEPFVAPKYGVTTQIPKDWRLAVREKDDRVFVAVIAQNDPDRPGIAACELGLAPESLRLSHPDRFKRPAAWPGERQAGVESRRERRAGRKAGNRLGIPSRFGRILARGHRPDHRQPA